MGAAKTNGIDPKVLERWTTEVLRIHDKLDEQRMENMRECKIIREPLPDLYESAKNAGLPSKAFKAHIKATLAQRAFDRAIAKATPEDSDDELAFDAMRKIATEGDLFSAAVVRHDRGKPDGQGGNDEEDLRPRHTRNGEADSDEVDAAQAERNAKALKRGITGLPGAEATEA